MAEAEIIPIAERPRKMTDEEFARRYIEFERRYPGNDPRDFNARRAMDLARLIAESGWTQEKLAEWFSNRHPNKPKKQRWASYQITFGRFLLSNAFSTNCAELPLMAEGAFRKFWEQQTDITKTDNERFADVVALIKANPPPRKTERTKEQKAADKQISARIVDRFADAKWHKPETIAGRLGIEPAEIIAALATLPQPKANPKAKVVVDERGQTHRIKPKPRIVVEKRGGGGQEEYRIIAQDKMLSAFALRKELGPAIDSLVNALKRAAEHPVHDNPRVTLADAQALKELFDRLTQ